MILKSSMRSKIHKNIHKQLNEIRKTMQDLNEKFSKEIGILKKEPNRNLGN
jgi:hypothetical protein